MPNPEGVKVVARNKRARHDYEILDTYEAGIVLTGSEVKSLRLGRASIAEAYVRPASDSVWVIGMHIPPYSFADGGGHEPTRERKLLLHRKEIAQIQKRVKEAGITVVVLSLHFRGGLAKLEIGVGRGKKLYDKRRQKAERDLKRSVERELSDRRRAQR